MLPDDFAERLWRKDGTLWSGGKYGSEATGFLGWLDAPRAMRGRVDELRGFAEEAKAAGFERVILAGMGGSSLAPLVLNRSLAQPTGLPMAVLDSTDPGTFLRIERLGPLERALVVVSSKSGTTAEPNAFCDALFDRMRRAKGEAAGSNFVAITDPGSPFAGHAAQLGFRRVFLNAPDIGGRYSALSYFGLVAGALAGVDCGELLDRALAVCAENEGPGAPAIELGGVLGAHAAAGRDKLTFLLPDELAYLGLWLEQLFAESTGKEGKGILPVAREAAGTPSEYGQDRVFVYLRRRSQETTFLDMRVGPLRDAGFPVVDVFLDDLYDIGREFMRWELAVAAAGAELGINPFDQPNVQESKDITKRYLAKLEAGDALPAEAPTVAEGEFQVFGGDGKSLTECVRDFLAQVRPGDYVCLQAYLTESDALDSALLKLQADIRDVTEAACTNGYGPRFLHSTGQYHKGGPNTGHFIQLTQDVREDAAIPGHAYSFGSFLAAQVRGDGDALRAKGRRVVRVHLGSDPVAGVRRLSQAVCEP